MSRQWKAEEDFDFGRPTGTGRVFEGAEEMSARYLPMKDVYLIAAAPEMLDALRDAHALICRTLCDEAAEHHREECTSALVAIAKAEHRCAACGNPPEDDKDLCTECLDMTWEMPTGSDTHATNAEPSDATRRSEAL